ncbi:MAG: cytidylate kinase family protein [Treponema sp.]|jgi:cytidylate kinase|nr:cytidylate kinase family protein [Treponema sp.]
MAIITLSRELAALGDETGREVANLFGYRFVDRYALEERIKAYGVPGAKLVKYDERKPSLWASLSQDRDDYLHYLKTALLDEAAAGNCLFIGRGAGLILKGIPAVVSLFLAAPLEIRVERVKSYFHCGDKRARQLIHQSDRDREGFHRYFFDARWKDPCNYHMVLNTGHIAPTRCAELVRAMLVTLVGADAEAAQKRRIGELTLAQDLKRLILYEKGIPVHFLEVTVTDGNIALYGVAGSQSHVEAAAAAVRERLPDAAVSSEIQVVQEYHVML